METAKRDGGIWGRVREDGEKVERGREEGSGRMLRVKIEGGHTGKKWSVLLYVPEEREKERRSCDRWERVLRYC